MKKFLSIIVIFVPGIFLIVLSSSFRPAVKVQQVVVPDPVPGNPLPDSVLKIVKTSCFDCHGSDGDALAKCFLNFGKWESYSSAKQVRKSKKMCKMVTKGKMPKKKFVKENPYKALDQKEIGIICNWSQALAKSAGK